MCPFSEGRTAIVVSNGPTLAGTRPNRATASAAPARANSATRSQGSAPVDAGRGGGHDPGGPAHRRPGGPDAAADGREPTGGRRLAPLRGAVPGRLVIGPGPCAHPAMLAESGRVG